MANSKIYADRVYQFYEFGFDLVLTGGHEKVHMEAVFEDTRDSLNNRHSYEVVLTDKSLESQGRTLENVLQLLEQTYREDIECAIDYTEYQKPDRIVIKIYEKENFETLVFIELYAKKYI